jgi:hypothetical protein
MISTHVVIWTALNVISCVFSGLKNEGKKVGFALSLGFAALSCGLLAGNAIAAWLGVEIALWILQLALAVGVSLLSPPNHDSNDANSLALAASTRLGIVMIIWLCL